MITGGSNAADAFLFVSLTALSASWPRREAGRCPGRHQRARCTANPRDVGKDLSHSEQLCGRARASTSTSVDTGSRSRICTCMPFDLGADISIEADAREPLASAETRAEASVEQTNVVRVFKLARRHVTQGGAANALASDVVQPENSIQPERKTLRAEDVALNDTSSDGKRL